MPYKINDRNFVLNHGKQYKILAVRDLPDEEKPREKLITNGVGSLSSVELLAIVLGVGTKKEEVFSMANRLLREYGEKGIAYQKNPTVIEKDLGIPQVKACQIVACFELGRRFYQKKPGGSITIRTAKQAYEYLKDMGNLNKEQFKVNDNRSLNEVIDELLQLQDQLLSDSLEEALTIDSTGAYFTWCTDSLDSGPITRARWNLFQWG
jgi:DNA repair protein RadC